MLAIKYAREQKVPFLGICLGFQLAVVEWARNICGIEGAYLAVLIFRNLRAGLSELGRRHLWGIRSQCCEPAYHLYA